MRAIVFMNAAAGSLDSSEVREEAARIGEALRAADVEADVRAVEAEALTDAAREAAGSGADVIVAAGGDGTIGMVAAVLAGGRTTLGVLPLGTLNHFAKDLGIPLELDEAARTLAAGRVREVDVGEVNGLVFVNNSSIGLYPRMVEEREEKRARGGLAKWPAMALAVLTVFRRFPLWRVKLRIDGNVVARTTPLLFVGNNRYQAGFLALQGRSCLDGGELSLYVARTKGRFGLVRLALGALVGRLDQDRDFEEMFLARVDVEATRRSLRVALDGEVTRLQPPLRYRIRPRVLRVVAPPPAA